MKKYLFALLVFYPLSAFSDTPDVTQQYLVGEWNVVGVKPGGQEDFRPLLQPAKWEFTKEGKFIENLGANSAQIHWNYKVENGEIQTSLGSMKFNWKIISNEKNSMIVQHHLGVFKVERK